MIDASGGPSEDPSDWEVDGRPAGLPALAEAPAVDWQAPPVALAGIGDLLPGPTLAARLAALDPATAGGWDLIEAIRGFERIVSWATAGQLAAVAALRTRPPGPGAEPYDEGDLIEAERHGDEHYGKDEFVVCEIAMALATSRAAAAGRLARAEALAGLPGTFGGLRAGELSVPKAYAIADTLSDPDLDMPETAAVEARVLPRAPQQTPGQLRAALRRAVLAADPGAAERRHVRAVAERRLRFWEESDGMAVLSLRTLAPTVHRLYDTAEVFAREAATPEDPRGVDARRVDALVDLIDAGTAALLDPASPHDPTAAAAETAVSDPTAGEAVPGGAPVLPSGRRLRRRPNLPVRVQLNVTVPVDTVLGLAETPGELTGYGPLPAGLTRRLAFGPETTWRRLLTDPVGRLLEIGGRRYPAPPPGTAAHDPGAALAEYVRARDDTCYAPGCRRAAARCSELPYFFGLRTVTGSGRVAIPRRAERCHHLASRARERLSNIPGGLLPPGGPGGDDMALFRRALAGTAARGADLGRLYLLFDPDERLLGFKSGLHPQRNEYVVVAATNLALYVYPDQRADQASILPWGDIEDMMLAPDCLGVHFGEGRGFLVRFPRGMGNLGKALAEIAEASEMELILSLR